MTLDLFNLKISCLRTNLFLIWLKIIILLSFLCLIGVYSTVSRLASTALFLCSIGVYSTVCRLASTALFPDWHLQHCFPIGIYSTVSPKYDKPLYYSPKGSNLIYERFTNYRYALWKMVLKLLLNRWKLLLSQPVLSRRTKSFRFLFLRLRHILIHKRITFL